MGKRQIIYKGQQIAGNRELLEKEINLVTKESRVWHGRIISVDQDQLELRDARSGKHMFRLDQIERIYREVVTDY
jgi:hypothetical protein